MPEESQPLLAEKHAEPLSLHSEPRALSAHAQGLPCSFSGIHSRPKHLPLQGSQAPFDLHRRHVLHSGLEKAGLAELERTRRLRHMVPPFPLPCPEGVQWAARNAICRGQAPRGSACSLDDLNFDLENTKAMSMATPP